MIRREQQDAPREYAELVKTPGGERLCWTGLTYKGYRFQWVPEVWKPGSTWPRKTGEKWGATVRRYVGREQEGTRRLDWETQASGEWEWTGFASWQEAERFAEDFINRDVASAAKERRRRNAAKKAGK